MRSGKSQQFERTARHQSRSHIRFTAIATALVIIVCGSMISAHAQNVAGNVSSLVGTASLQRAGTAINVTVGMAVQVSDQIAVASGGKMTITLSDGSILEAGPSSTIVIDQQLLGSGGARAATRISILTGLLRSVVKHSSHGNPPNFEVHTPNAILAARSTMFDTAYEQGLRRFGYGACNQFTDVQSYKGSVGVRNAATPNAEETSVGTGYETTVPCDSPPQSAGPLGMTGIPAHGVSALTETEPGAVVAPPAAAPALPGGVGGGALPGK